MSKDNKLVCFDFVSILADSEGFYEMSDILIRNIAEKWDGEYSGGGTGQRLIHKLSNSHKIHAFEYYALLQKTNGDKTFIEKLERDISSTTRQWLEDSDHNPIVQKFINEIKKLIDQGVDVAITALSPFHDQIMQILIAGGLENRYLNKIKVVSWYPDVEHKGSHYTATLREQQIARVMEKFGKEYDPKNVVLVDKNSQHGAVVKNVGYRYVQIGQGGQNEEIDALIMKQLEAADQGKKEHIDYKSRDRDRDDRDYEEDRGHDKKYTTSSSYTKHDSEKGSSQRESSRRREGEKSSKYDSKPKTKGGYNSDSLDEHDSDLYQDSHGHHRDRDRDEGRTVRSKSRVDDRDQGSRDRDRDRDYRDRDRDYEEDRDHDRGRDRDYEEDRDHDRGRDKKHSTSSSYTKHGSEKGSSHRESSRKREDKREDKKSSKYDSKPKAKGGYDSDSVDEHDDYSYQYSREHHRDRDRDEGRVRSKSKVDDRKKDYQYKYDQKDSRKSYDEKGKAGSEIIVEFKPKPGDFAHRPYISFKFLVELVKRNHPDLTKIDLNKINFEFSANHRERLLDLNELFEELKNNTNVKELHMDGFLADGKYVDNPMSVLEALKDLVKTNRYIKMLSLKNNNLTMDHREVIMKILKYGLALNTLGNRELLQDNEKDTQIKSACSQGTIMERGEKIKIGYEGGYQGYIDKSQSHKQAELSRSTKSEAWPKMLAMMNDRFDGVTTLNLNEVDFAEMAYRHQSLSISNDFREGNSNIFTYLVPNKTVKILNLDNLKMLSENKLKGAEDIEGVLKSLIKLIKAQKDANNGELVIQAVSLKNDKLTDKHYEYLKQLKNFGIHLDLTGNKELEKTDGKFVDACTTEYKEYCEFLTVDNNELRGPGDDYRDAVSHDTIHGPGGDEIVGPGGDEIVGPGGSDSVGLIGGFHHHHG